MDLEAPLDAWYVWLGVATVSVLLAGLALSLPTEPTPDADEAVNTIDRVGASPHQAAGSYAHNADEAKIGTSQLALRNDAGTSRATVAFQTMTPIRAIEDPAVHDALEKILSGSDPETVSQQTGISQSTLSVTIADTNDKLRTHGPEWRPTSGTLRVRQVTIGTETVVLVDA